MAIKTFVSYAATEKNKKTVDDLKSRLGELGLDVFAAHGDIGGGKSWPDTIMREIRECELFLALVTSEYRERVFTEQELGMAIYAGKPIISIVVGDATPGGFADIRYQYVKFSDTDNTAKKVAADARELVKDPDRVDPIIQRLATSRDFTESNKLARLLDPCADLSKQQATNLARAFNDNDQVHTPRFSGDRVAFILYRHQRLLEPRVWRGVVGVCGKAGIDLRWYEVGPT